MFKVSSPYQLVEIEVLILLLLLLNTAIFLLLFFRLKEITFSVIVAAENLMEIIPINIGFYGI